MLFQQPVQVPQFRNQFIARGFAVGQPDNTLGIENVLARFVLADEERRHFRAQRWCYRGSIDDWIDVGPIGPVDRLARQLIKTLGTDAFFGLF